MALLAAGCAACSVPGSKVPYDDPVILQGSRPGLFGLEDYFEAGDERLGRYLASRGDAAALRQARATGAAACVRVWFLQSTELETRGSAGSGVLIEPGGFVVTASHIVPPDGDHGVEVLLACGRRIVAREVPSPAPRPWALFRLEGEELEDLPRLPTARPRRGGTYWLLGYPAGQIGWADHGRLAASGPSAAAALAPIALLGRLDASSPPELTVLAGTMSQSGMSGGPVVDANGRLVAVLESAASEIGRESVHVSVFANSLAGLEDLVREARGEVRP